MKPSRRPDRMLLIAIAAGLLAGPAPAPADPDHADLMVVRDADGAARPVRSVADWEARRGRILGHLQEVMGPLPGPERRVALEPKVTSEAAEDGYTLRKVEYQVEPGDRVSAWLLIPSGKTGRRPAMLCLHQTTPAGKDEPIGRSPNRDLWYARELAQRGYVAIAPDYPGFGESRRDAYAMGYASASMKAVWDNIRAVDLLATLPEVDPDRIGVIGHSLGGHNAIFTAVFEPRLRAVVSSCGFTAFPSYYGGNVAGWSHRGYMPRLRDVYGLDLKRIPFDFPELIGALAPRPFFTCSPLHDANFEVEGVRGCIRAARPIYELYGADANLVAEYPDAGHSFEPRTRDKSYRFLDSILKP